VNERGTALIEMLVLSFALALVVIPSFAAVARIVDARVAVDDVAHDVAVWEARHGARYPGADGIEVQVRRTRDAVAVIAAKRVDIIGIGSTGLGITVRSAVEVPVSPYRSDR